MAQIVAQFALTEMLKTGKKVLTPDQTKKMFNASEAQNDCAQAMTDMQDATDAIAQFIKIFLPLAQPLQLMVSEIQADTTKASVDEMIQLFKLLQSPGGKDVTEAVGKLIASQIKMTATLFTMVEQNKALKTALEGLVDFLKKATLGLKLLGDMLFKPPAASSQGSSSSNNGSYSNPGSNPSGGGMHAGGGGTRTEPSPAANTVTAIWNWIVHLFGG